MRLVLVQRDTGVQPGMCVGLNEAPDSRRRAALDAAKAPHALKLKVGARLPFVGGVVDAATLDELMAAAYQAGQAAAAVEQCTTSLSSVQRDAGFLTVPRGNDLAELESFTVKAPDARLRSAIYASVPAIRAHFRDEAQLAAFFGSDGGASRVHVIELGVARRKLRRHGGGVLEEGAFVVHPKRDDVLVPLHSYHTELMQEVTREVHVALGRLGARSLEIETIEGVAFSGSVESKIPLKSGRVAGAGRRSTERRLKMEWGSQNFEHESALDNCVWFRDHAWMLTLFEQRATSNLTRYDEVVVVDTAFGVSVEIMKIFNKKFDWAVRSSYRIAVSFYARPTSRR